MDGFFSFEDLYAKKSRYPAPMYFITEKATVDFWIIMESPVAAARVCMRIPRANPRDIEIPVFLPLLRLSVSTKMLSGPGIKISKMDAPR